MRIGVDVSSCWNRRGFGRFARELLAAMVEHEPAHEWMLVADRTPAPGDLPEGCTVVHARPDRTVTESAAAGSRRSLRDLRRFRKAVEALNVDVFFFPAVYSYFPLSRRISQVVCFHDTIAEDHPELIFDTRIERFAWWAKVRSARRNARRFMTVSEASKRRLVDRFGLDPAGIDVVSEGASVIFRPDGDPERARVTRAKLGVGPKQPFLLSVGGLSPHKNLDAMLTAFEGVETQPTCALVIVGDPDADGFLGCGASLARRVRSSARLRERVVFTGYVTDDELAELYREASALVFPSLNEGFGLPALEALACGTPVLASTAGSLPEVVGDAGLYFDPTDTGAMTACMVRFLTDEQLRNALGALTLPRARHYTWDRAADQALASLRAAIA